MNRMKKLSIVIISIIALVIASVVYVVAATEEGVEGYYSYSKFNGKVTITDVDESICGTVVVPEKIDGCTVTAIENFAFSGCSEITEIEVPNTVESIGQGAFNGLNNLTDITLPFVGGAKTNTGVNGVFGYIFGYTYISNSTGKVENAIYQYRSSNYYWYYVPQSLRHITITEDTTIPDCAFLNCSFVESITIPDNTTSIGVDAFCNCSSITETKIPNGIKTIFEGCYYGCSNLTSITIPDTVTDIRARAFCKCDSLSEIVLPKSLEKIGEYAFSAKIKNKELIVPDSVNIIGRGAFKGWNELTDITLPYVGCTESAETFMAVFGYIFDYTTTTYGKEVENAIYQYRSGDYYWYYVPQSLRHITITEDTTIPDCAFLNCSFVESITIPDNTTSIGVDAFYNCSELKALYTSNEIISIGLNAMYKCPNLTVFGVKDSYTNKYCTDNTIPFVAYEDIVSIEVKQVPTKKQYVGNEVNTTGLILTANLVSGSQIDIYSGYSVTADKFDSAGEKTIKVSCFDKETEFKVNVVGINTIMVINAPVKTTYFVGDTIDCTGLIFKVSYADGTIAIKNADYTVSVTQFIKSGEQIVYVYYYGATGTFKANAITVGLTNVEILTEPNKKDYFAGEQVELTGLILKLTYNNGKTATVGSGFTTSTTLKSSAVKSVEVEYLGFKVSYEVQVTDVVCVSWAMTSQPIKLDYYVGDSIDTSGLVITEYYNNGTSKEFTSGFVCTPNTLSAVGEQIITVNYAGATTMFVVNVSEKPILGRVKSVDIDDISLNYKNTTTITPKIEADDGVTYTVEYTISNPNVATVDNDGKVYAAKRGSGSATITCTVTDQYGNVVTDECKVNVSLTFVQKLIVYVLFGWIWY